MAKLGKSDMWRHKKSRPDIPSDLPFHSRGDWIRTSDPLLPKAKSASYFKPSTCGFVIRVLPEVYGLIWGFMGRLAKDGNGYTTNLRRSETFAVASVMSGAR